MRNKAVHGWGMFFLVMCVGAVLGGLLGEIIGEIPFFASMTPYLTQTYKIIDIAPSTINLYVIKITAGFVFQPNVISVLGVVVAIFLFKRI